MGIPQFVITEPEPESIVKKQTNVSSLISSLLKFTPQGFEKREKDLAEDLDSQKSQELSNVN
jgi:hypothetical protein